LRADVAELLGDQGPGRFDRHEHHSFAERGPNEAVALAKLCSDIVDGMSNDTAHAGNLRGRKTSFQRVPQ
jgi:hypothetical protein